MKRQGFDFTNPNRLFHLFRQLFECIAIAANYAIGNLHLGAELVVVWAYLESCRNLVQVDRIAFSDVQARQRFLWQNDAGGVADCNDLGSRGHEGPPQWLKYNISYNRRLLTASRRARRPGPRSSPRRSRCVS